MTTKIHHTIGISIDLSRNGEMIQENLAVKMGSKPKHADNKFKRKGLQKLQQFDIEEAIDLFHQSFQFQPNDSELYFHLACAYSNKEDKVNGFKALQKAVELGFPYMDDILTHEKLAFLRMQSEFEDFLESGYSKLPLYKDSSQ